MSVRYPLHPPGRHVVPCSGARAQSDPPKTHRPPFPTPSLTGLRDETPLHILLELVHNSWRGSDRAHVTLATPPPASPRATMLSSARPILSPSTTTTKSRRRVTPPTSTGTPCFFLSRPRAYTPRPSAGCARMLAAPPRLTRHTPRATPALAAGVPVRGRPALLRDGRCQRERDHPRHGAARVGFKAGNCAQKSENASASMLVCAWSTWYRRTQSRHTATTQ